MACCGTLGAMDLSPGSLSLVTMDTDRAVVYGVIGLVLVTTLASGPLVSPVDFTISSGESSFDGGNATIGNVTLPSGAEITDGRYGSGEYYLRVPDATVEVIDVTGNPLLAYRISIPAMGYARTTTHFVSPADVGVYGLSLQRDAVEPSLVEEDTYQGRLRVFLRSNGTERQLATRNISVEVTE